MCFIYPHHIKSVYTLSKLHIISSCGSLQGLSERMDRNILLWVFTGFISFQTYVVRTELQQYPTWAACSFQKFPLIRSINQIPGSCIKGLFILSFITQRKADVWLPCVCVCVTCAGQPYHVSMETSHIVGEVTYCRYYQPDERSFLYFCYSHALRSFILSTKWSQLLWRVKRSHWMTDVFREHYLDELRKDAEWDTFPLWLKTEAGAAAVNIHI